MTSIQPQSPRKFADLPDNSIEAGDEADEAGEGEGEGKGKGAV